MGLTSFLLQRCFSEKEQKSQIQLSGKDHVTFLDAVILFEVNRLQYTER